MKCFSAVLCLVMGDVGRNAICIDVDANEWIYTGGHWSNTYMVRYKVGEDPSDPETLIEKDMEINVTDISIDRDSNLIYTTTRREVVAGRIGATEVYDPTNWSYTNSAGLVQTDIESDEDYGGPAGIAVGLSYKDPNLYVDKIDDIGVCALPEDTITYTIGYRPGAKDAANVAIVDYLPVDVELVTADPATGFYDPIEHSYTWDIGSLAANEPNEYVYLEVQVYQWVQPGSSGNRLWMM